MTNEEAIKELKESHDIMRSYDVDESESRLMIALDMAIKALEQQSMPTMVYPQVEGITPVVVEPIPKLPSVNPQPCDDAISRQAVLDLLEDTNNGWIINEVLQLPTVTPQEPSITWVTGADGAKIAFWDVPVWKATKICEILGEPQEGSEE